MKTVLVAFLALFFASDYVEPPDMCIPDKYIQLIKSTDYLEAKGINAVGYEDDFTIHNAKAISQFVELLTSQRYVPAPKSLDPHFKSPSHYDVRLYSKGQLVLEFRVVAVSVLDLPGDPNFYMESSRHDEVLMAPLFRLR
jgi:hypothetical protein